MTVYRAAKSCHYQFKAVAALLLGTKQELVPPRTHQTRAGCQEYKSVLGAGATGAEAGAGWGGGEANLFCVKLCGKYQIKRPKSYLTEKKPHC